MTQTKALSNVVELTTEYLSALGGLENIQEIDACITRLRLHLRDHSVIDEDKLKSLGAMGVVKVDAHNLQVIVGPQADCMAKHIKSLK